MRLLHTADWHLGKTLNGKNLIEDQRYVLLDKLFEVIGEEKPNAIIIAGDIYDRADPSTEAVNLFDEIIFKLTEKKIPVLCIAGNHDNIERLNFGSRLFANKKFYITTKTAFEPKNIPLDDEFGEVYFSLIPYFDPAEIKSKFLPENEERLTFDAANKFYLDLARKNIPSGKRSVAIAHVFVEGGEESDSERKFVGTTGKVRAENFSGYDYVALGHLHRPQNIFDNIRYSGSPLKYSAKEAKHVKGVSLVELDGKGFVCAKNIPLAPLRDLIEVSGTLEYFLSQPPADAYAYITLTDKEFVYDAAQKLREVFPYIMEAKNESRPRNFIEEPTRRLRENSTLYEQFSDFFKEMTRRSLNHDEQEALKEIFGG
ncbi:MAG: exonuclease SbcCD subunit D [Selenomonadaceae bacterium]|nr:exonuclease SbcCD subunit D [Selenomonadaceae bacterium]